MEHTTNTLQQHVVKERAAGLSRFTSTVYLWMMVGLAISGGVAYYISIHPAIVYSIAKTPTLFFGLIIAQLAAVMAFSFLNRKLNPAMATLLYLVYTVLVGVTFSVILFAYTRENIYNAFAVTAGAFFALSAFGYITKRDLGPLGTFVTMGLFGVIILMVLSFFIPELQSSTAQMVISGLGVIVFAGLTAYDTQKIKMMYLQSAGADEAQTKKFAINGALSLYLDFINLFLMLLRLFGGRR